MLTRLSEMRSHHELALLAGKLEDPKQSFSFYAAGQVIVDHDILIKAFNQTRSIEVVTREANKILRTTHDTVRLVAEAVQHEKMGLVLILALPYS